MELKSKILEQMAFITRCKIEEQMLIVMDKSTDEEQLSIPLQTNIMQFKKTINFLTEYIGIFNVTNKNKKLNVAKSITDKDGYIQLLFYQVLIKLNPYMMKIGEFLLKKAIIAKYIIQTV